MSFRVTRTPGQSRRLGRSMDRLSDDDSTTDSASAIQTNDSGQITLILASGEPFTQSASGLAMTITTSDFLSVVSASLAFNDDELLKQMVYYGSAFNGVDG